MSPLLTNVINFSLNPGVSQPKTRKMITFVSQDLPAGESGGRGGGRTAVVTDIPEADPGLSEHIVAIRNRFGLDGLREAQRLIATEIAIFEHAYDDLEKL